MAVGGYFDGLIAPDYDTFTEKNMYVDYVRVYQRPVEEGEDEKNDSAELEAAGKTDGESSGKNDGLYGDYRVGVRIPLESMTLDKDSIFIQTGGTAKITPAFSPENSTEKSVTWTSSNLDIATVSDGVVMGIKPGTVTITAEAAEGAIKATCEVVVTGDAISSVAVTPDKLSLEEGKRSRLTAVVTPSTGNQNVIWTSSDTSIATVDTDGTVTAVKAGEAAITAKVEGSEFSGTCVVTVTAPPPVSVTGVRIKNGNDESGEATIQTESSVTLMASITPTNATNKNVTWKSEDESIATVDDNGKVTGVKEGYTTITVETEDGKKTDTWNVIVTKKPAALEEGKGVKRDKDGNVVLYVSKSSVQTQITAFCTIVDSKEKAEEINVIDSRLPGYNMSETEKEWQYSLGKQDDTKWLVYAFSHGVQNMPIAIAIKDIPAESSGDDDNEVISVESITLNPTQLTMLKGDSYTLKATVLPYDAADRTVTWTSNSKDVVEVDDKGKLTAKSVGTAEITVTTNDGNKAASCIVTVNDTFKVEFKDDDEVVDIQNVTSGGKVEKPDDLKKQGYIFGGWFDAQGNEYDFDTQINQDTVLTAKWNPIKVSKIQMSANINLEKGKTTSITPMIIPADALDTGVVWTSNNPSIATIDEETGVITAVETGTVKITATAKDGSNVSAECEVTVTEAVNEKAWYTVDFVSNEKKTSVEVEEGKAVVKPNDPELAGYDFIGWYEGDVLYDFDSLVTKDIVLNAKFKKNDQTAANEVIELIDKIGDNVTLASKGAIEAARKAYDALTDAQKKLVTNADKLTSAEAKLEQLEKAQKNDTTEETSKPETPGITSGGTSKPETPGTTSGGTSKPEIPGTTSGGTDQEVKVENIKIIGLSKKIAINKKIKLIATVTPSNATNLSVTWSSSNTKYATVDKNGVVKMKKAGKNKTVTITAASADGSGVKAVYKIKIMPKAVKKVTLKASATAVKAGKKVTLKASVTPSNKKLVNTTLKWSSSNTKYATVNKRGVVTTKRAGKGKKVKITAYATDGSSKKKTITIKIK